MYSLDGARGFAAFCILLFHVVGTRINAFSHLYIAVDFFFVLSGFVLAPAVARVKDFTEARRFLVSRFIRIFPMVLAIVLFTATYDLVIIVKHWSVGEPTTSPIILSIPTLLISLSMLQIFYSPAILVDYPVWSLSAEWVANIGVTLIKVLSVKAKYMSLAVGAVLIIASVACKSELLNQLGRALWGFSFGLIAFDLHDNYPSHRKIMIPISLLLAPIYFGASHLGGYESLFSVWPFAAWILILAKLNSSTKTSKFLSLAGKYSYGFYLWHFPILSLIGFFLNQVKFNSTSTLRILLEIALTSMMSILATKVSLTFIEEPIRRHWGNKSKMV
jgi:peptidoglycan/LPS O-acetylase OafA/YrhL